MSDQEYRSREYGIVKGYLWFLDNNVLFKKPISCLAAIISFLIPFLVLSQFIRFEIFKSGEVNMVFASILILLVFAFAGIFGALIWWHRRITLNEGPKLYVNFRRFVQTIGEWLATFIAISVFGVVLVLVIFLSEEYHFIAGLLPFAIPHIDIFVAFSGIIAGFVIIIVTKLLLFLLDPLVWLIKQIWNFIKWLVLYCYRVILNLLKTIEKNTPFWVGVTWIVAVGVIITTLVLCFRFFGAIAPVIALAAALAFMGYFMFKRKHYNE